MVSILLEVIIAIDFRFRLLIEILEAFVVRIEAADGLRINSPPRFVVYPRLYLTYGNFNEMAEVMIDMRLL